VPEEILTAADDVLGRVPIEAALVVAVGSVCPGWCSEGAGCQGSYSGASESHCGCAVDLISVCSGTGDEQDLGLIQDAEHEAGLRTILSRGTSECQYVSVSHFGRQKS
jgi:hypothetical protein